jgi:hypothetical protein
MFVRRRCKIVSAESHEYWTLCESRRTAAGPRWEMVDVHGVRVERARDSGEAFLGLALWPRLGLHTLLADLIEPGGKEVPWPTVASLLAVAGFCGQRSELGIAERWYAHSAIEDLPGVGSEKAARGSFALALADVIEKPPQVVARLFCKNVACATDFGVEFVDALCHRNSGQPVNRGDSGPGHFGVSALRLDVRKLGDEHLASAAPVVPPLSRCSSPRMISSRLGKATR